MGKRILLLMLVVASTLGQLRAQNTEAPIGTVRDSVVYQTTFYFQLGVGKLTQQSHYAKMNRLLGWAQSDTTTSIEITGWADKTGTPGQNEKLSLCRASAIRNYLVHKGIASERITFEGQGVDTQADSDDKARRADVRGVIRLVVMTEPTNKPQSKPMEVTAVVAGQPAEQPKHELLAAEPAQEQREAQPAVEPNHPKSPAKSNLRWYAGVEGGVLLGVSTLSSFSPKGGAGWNVGVLGGYRISPLLSAEVGISFGGVKLGANKCCADYFLGADGERYLGHVAGMDSYSYRDIYSSVSMQQYALRLNIDMLQTVRPDWNKRWSLNVSPAIYGINSTATLKASKATIIKRDSQFQFGAGIGIGCGYQITKNLGIGIRSGAVWVFGRRYDGLLATDHSNNMIWNNTLTLTWRFGCNK